MVFDLHVFRKSIVLRQLRPHWDVVISKDVRWAMVSQERFVPPPVPSIPAPYMDRWPYGPAWRLVHVPGLPGLFVVYENHLKNDSWKVSTLSA